jgi:REP element-mobilizing transposase RayT
MPRKPRLHSPGAVYHVMLRDNARQNIFFDADDRLRFVAFLRDGMERFGFRVHGYCLMTNHLHLALQVGDIPLSRIMQNLALRYTKWVNWRQNRGGHLFQGRYKAIMIEADNHLAQLVAYLHLNPVRAGMCAQAIDYPWSSQRAYLGLEQTPWLTMESVLALFSPDLRKARRLFREFVETSASDGHRPEFHGRNTTDSRVFGNDSFVEEVLRNEPERRVTLTLNHVLAAVYEICELTAEEMRSASRGRRIAQGRALAAWGVLNLCDGTLTELGKRVRRDVSSLSSAARRLLIRSKKDDRLAARMDSINKRATEIATLQP